MNWKTIPGIVSGKKIDQVKGALEKAKGAVDEMEDAED